MKFHRVPRCLAPAVIAFGIFAGTAGADDTERTEFFETYIRPALAEHCLDCHSTESEANGNLVLDSRRGWESGGDFGPAIVPGDASASLLIRAIEYSDPDMQMPPDGKLDDVTIRQLRTWVEQGAADPREDAAEPTKKQTGLPVDRASEHWAYRPIKTMSSTAGRSPSAVVDQLWGTTADTSNSQRLDAAQLRRLSFDLTGLPPTGSQLQKVRKGGDIATRRRLIDSMLASPAYAETFARRWMDVARYAESITLRGFILSHAWRYRDYLITAYAEDRGFDEMIVDQIAGDLLDHQDISQQQLSCVATGFLAMGNTNLEDQDKTKLEFDFIDEQLDTIGRAFLGQTIGCARCHDHKFDPIPTADYYAMTAVMRSTVAMKHGNLSSWIDRPLPLPTQQQRHYDNLTTERDEIAGQIKSLKATLNPTGAYPKSVPADSLAGVVVDDTHAKAVGKWVESSFVSGYVGKGYRHDDNKDRGTKTITFEPKNLSTGRYEVRLSYTSGESRSTKTKVRVFSANETSEILVNQREIPNVDGIWKSLGEFPFESDGLAFVMVSNEEADGHVIADAVQFLPVDQIENVVSDDTKTDDKVTEETKRQLAKLESRLKKLDQQLAGRPQYLSVNEGEPVSTIPVRIRGVHQQHGTEVSRGFLTAVGRAGHWGEQIDDQQSGRLQMARWIADAENPLTARVYANRVWLWLMGDGIVATPNNFGTTGAQPSHPELLDYLAGELIRTDWSTKHLVRVIVNSQAYRNQTSRPRRLSIEAMHDTMLLVSGELDRTAFGSTIRTGTKADYNYDQDSRRRSVYLPVFRNSVTPLHKAFDFADTSISIGQRAKSTVATQSLVMMNDPWIIQRANAAADRCLETVDDQTWDTSTKDAVVNQMFEVCLSRLPTDAERSASVDFLNERDNVVVLIHSLFASIDFRYLD